MRRHISIFAFLLSTFAVGSLFAGDNEIRVVSTLPCQISYTYAVSTENVSFKTPATGAAWYYSPDYRVHEDDDYSHLQLNDTWSLEAQLDKGVEFKGWFTVEGQVVQGNPPVGLATVQIGGGKALLSGKEIRDAAGTWKTTSKTEETAFPFIVAKYEKIKFDVTFDSKGGDPDKLDPIKDRTIDSPDISLPTVTRNGWKFTGWKNGRGKIFTGTSCKCSDFWYEDGISRGFDASLTAQWDGLNYSITLDRDGGTGGSCPGEYTVSENPQGLEITPPTKEGHTIQGWKVDGATGGSPTVAGSPLTLTIPKNTYGNLTLKPVWAKTGYSLIIHHEGAYYGGKLMEKTTLEPLVSNATNFNEILVAVATNDATFYGYYDSLEGGTQVYDKQGKCCKVTGIWSAVPPDGTYQGNADLEVWAKWGPPPEHCTIRAVCDPAVGGTVEPASTNVVKGEGVTLTATANTGYSFCCWTNETGDVISANHHDTFTVNADATYTAVFTGNVYTVTYYGMDGEPEEQTKPVRFGSPYGEPPQEVTRSGYVLKGWNTHAKGKGDWIAATDIVMTATDQELYAIWEPKSEFDVIFVDKDGTNGAITNKNVTSGTVISAAPEATKGWKRQYYDLVGWDPPLPQTVGLSDLEFTAVWRSVSDVLDCTNLLFNAVGNWEICTDDFVVGDSCMKLPKSGGNDLLSATITEAGTLSFNWKVDNAKFVVSTNGQDIWSSEKKSERWAPDNKETIELAGPCELRFYGAPTEFINYCLIDNVTWTPKGEEPKYTLTVTSAGNGMVEKSPDDDDYAAGASVTISATPSDGYAFERWSDGSAENPRQIVVISNATYIATFAALPPDEYTLEVLSTGHGAVAKNPSQAKYEEDTQVTITATPDPGYAFEKWSDGSAVNSRQITVISNAVYSADFTNCSYVVTFDAAGGTASRDKKTVKYGESYGDLPTAEKSGSVFIGWFLGETEIKSETLVSATHDHSLVAKWKQDVGEVSAALDCDNLAFTATGGWTICTDHDFAYTAEGGNDSCLRTSSADEGTGLTATIRGSGSLSFHWRAKAGTSLLWLTVTAGDTVIFDEEVAPEESTGGWLFVADKRIEVAAGKEVTLKFECGKNCEYLAVDDVTWTPDGKEPSYATKDTPVTGFSMADGKIGFSFAADGSTTYHILGTNDVTAPWPWPFVREIKPGETQPVQIDIKADEPKMFYRIRALK